MTDTDRPLIYVLNGPNLNLLGSREPEIYGHDTLDDIEQMLEKRAEELDVDVRFYQSNHEGQLIDWMHHARANQARAVIINPAGFTHTSIALLDAALAITLPVFEVHLSDPAKREEFRHISYIGRAARATIAGKGAQGYLEALELAASCH